MLGLSTHRFPGLLDEMSRMGRMFDRFHGYDCGARVFPPMNVYDDGDAYTVRAEIPGVEPGDIQIQATARALQIKGERKPKNGDAKVSYHRRERDHGVFDRSINLPQPIDPDEIVASYEDGVLEVVLPKADEVRARRIQVSN